MACHELLRLFRFLPLSHSASEFRLIAMSQWGKFTKQLPPPPPTHMVSPPLTWQLRSSDSKALSRQRQVAAQCHLRWVLAMLLAVPSWDIFTSLAQVINSPLHKHSVQIKKKKKKKKKTADKWMQIYGMRSASEAATPVSEARVRLFNKRCFILSNEVL